MVGVRKSNRCDNCRIRKKKCDEKRPACSECIRSGWTCPGYKTTLPWRFVDEAPRLASQYAGRKYIYDSISSNFDEDQETNLKGVMVWKRTQIKALIPRYHEINPLGPAFVYCLDSKVNESLVSLRISGSCFDFVPARLGHNVALDDAVSCICAIYCRRPSISYTADREIYQSYVKALSSLRGYLSDDYLRMEAETLCASILLQMCELVVSTGRGDWGSLARGTSALLSSRGVQRYSSEFELAMLECQLPHVFGQSLKLKEHCFLSSPEWQTLLQQGPVWPYHTTQASSLSLRTRLITTLSEMPNLVWYHSNVDGDEMYHRSRKEGTDLLIEKAIIMLNGIKSWLTLEAEHLFLSSSSSSPGLQEYINYQDLLVGIVDCVANTALVTIDRILRSLYNAKMVSSVLMGESLGLGVEFDGPEVVEGWRRRAVSAFEYVKGESVIAAKPLDFGVRQIEAFGYNS
ncbi:hypothetical protein LARI1_G002605 [Lachnellula arida]|uniref:Zn(2)-C6 fungal-type domain-containing protein n=1 Tax=Lachnellula arida TaxID=1316785 RepID=A0A8T9BJ20_9HELO|nr:hypothetical protein LARI1_G002605 [Lachnellula arida]